MYNIVHFNPSVNIPYPTLKTLTKGQIEEKLAKADGKTPEKVFVSCRRGNDSRRAVEYLTSVGIKAVNVKGGIEEYGKQFDREIPGL